MIQWAGAVIGFIIEMWISNIVSILIRSDFDVVPYNERQWGHWLARNLINTKQKLGLGLN